MTELCTETEIQASAERVWQVLTDFALYREWNPVIHTLSGEARAGGHLRFRVHPRSNLGVTMRTTVVKAEANRELRWRGRLLFSGLFCADHSFTLEPVAKSRVRLIQRETYRGLLAPIIVPIIKATNLRLFADMNKALKARAEDAPAESI